VREKILTEKSRVSAIFNEKSIPLIQNKNVLDLGTHQGDLSNHALDLGAKSVTAIEKTKEDFDIAKDLFPNVNFINMSVEDLEILEYIEKAEVVFCLGIFYLLKNQKELFLNISKNKNIKTVIVDYACVEEDVFFETKQRGEDFFLDMMSTNNLEKMFVDSGFEILSKTKYNMEIQNIYMRNRICFLLHRK
jgi:16S rRNA G966 N2-methylase RsmD